MIRFARARQRTDAASMVAPVASRRRRRWPSGRHLERGWSPRIALASAAAPQSRWRDRLERVVATTQDRRTSGVEHHCTPLAMAPCKSAGLASPSLRTTSTSSGKRARWRPIGERAPRPSASEHDGVGRRARSPPGTRPGRGPRPRDRCKPGACGSPSLLQMFRSPRRLVFAHVT